MKFMTALRTSTLTGLALGTMLVSAIFGSALDDDSQSDCPEDQCIPFEMFGSTELEFSRPELPDHPPETGAEWINDDSGKQKADTRERDNGTANEEMADPAVSADGETATVTLYNRGYVTDSERQIYDFFPWACIEVYVRFHYRYKITRYVYKTLTKTDGTTHRLIDYTYVTWKDAWVETCVSQICPCPPESEDGTKSE